MKQPDGDEEVTITQTGPAEFTAIVDTKKGRIKLVGTDRDDIRKRALAMLRAGL